MSRIELTQGKFAIVDEQDFERVRALRWYAVGYRGHWYAQRGFRINGKCKTESLHHFILGIPSSQPIDHANGDGLDCRRENIRPCTKSENGRNRGKQANNTSGYKGVSWSKHFKHWRAQIWMNGNNIFLGYFKEKTVAARAYNEAAIKYFGEFARIDKGAG